MMAQLDEGKKHKPSIGRGRFIVFEGGDRCGKTSQIQMLADSLSVVKPKQLEATSGDASISADVRIFKFPNRASKITGNVINSYLTSKMQLEDHAVHLLFSANRWEVVQEITELLDAGITCLVDRYSWSGIVYSAAKGLPLDFCKGSDMGLPRPDLVFFLELDPSRAALRGDYGQERFEKLEFQTKVASLFKELIQDDMKTKFRVIDADRDRQEIAADILAQVYQLDEMWKSSHKSTSIDWDLWKNLV